MNYELKRINLFYNFLFSIKKFLVVALLFFCTSVYSQSEYKIYYYSDTIKSSEGLLVDGKPDGYWKNYYVNGNLKSIGKRSNFKLDSVWNFYTTDGFLDKTISYFEGNKNGFYTEYYPSHDSVLIKYQILYVNDLREGDAQYFDITGKLLKTIPFKNDKKDGQGFEYSDSLVSTVTWYENNNLLSQQSINRTNKEGKKYGTWMDFHANGNLKTESNYVDGQLNGLYKLFDTHQRLLRVGHYQEDSLLYSSQAMVDFEEPFEKSEYYNDSTLKYRGAYKDVLPIGIHRFYNKNGTIDSCFLYDNLGTFLGKGVMLDNGQKIGFWTFYYPSGKKKESGNFVEDMKSGNWKFFYETGELKQEGIYLRNKPTSVWKWYFKTGELKKEEEYAGGKRNGLSIQYDITGKKVAEGMYVDGKEHGQWTIKTGDIIEKGLYNYGSKEKLWQSHFTNGQLQFKGFYFNTKPHKKHQYFYDNGKLEHDEYYKLGKPVKKWEYYNRDGELLYTIYYKNGKEYKIVTASNTDN